MISNNGLALFLIYLALVLIPLVQSIPWLLSYWVFRRKGLLWAVIGLPFFYLTYEIVHFHWELSYVWLHYGLGLSNSPQLLKLYPFIGMEGGTFYIILTNAFLYLFANSVIKHQFKIHFLIWPILLLSIPLMIPDKNSEENKEKVNLAIFQPHTDPFEIITNETINERYRILEDAVRDIDSTDVSLVLCPEGYFKNFHNNPIIMNDPYRHSVVKKLIDLSRDKGFAIISGVVVIQLYFTHTPPTITARLKKEGLYYDTYNAVMLIEPSGKIQWRSKVRLVPFAERVPFLRLFRFLEVFHLDFNQSKGSYDFEHRPTPFEYKNLKIGPLICYESLYPDVTSLFIHRKANVIMEFSNENWTEKLNMGQIQHESYAKINAAQFGVDYIRSTYNSGSLILSELPYEYSHSNKNKILTGRVQLTNKKSFYVQNRQWWNVVVVVTIAIFVLTLYSKK